MKRSKPRSVNSQIQRMAIKWPSLEMNIHRPLMSGTPPCIQWVGPVRGFQRDYRILVQWTWLARDSFPCVFLLSPFLRPRAGADYIDIPHLIHDDEEPENSALCLFDPDEGQWDTSMWISDTTVPWASEWLHHYEFWHLDGIWRGANAPGPINIRQVRMLKQEGHNGERS